jgi:hypothetical protein
MNISEHTTAFEQEMKRRNFGQQTTENYLSCIKKFFGQSTVKTTNIYTHISHNLISKISSPLNEINL